MSLRAMVPWLALLVFLSTPVIVAAQSPLLQWRDPVYIAAGFAGIIGLCLMLLQPLLISRMLPTPMPSRLHRWIGLALVTAIVIHVAGLWITSPPDVIDVLMFRSPTSFSIWGAVAMWAVFAAALWAAIRKQTGVRLWRLGHSVAVGIAVLATVVHAWRVDGTMGTLSKAALCISVIVALVLALRKRRVWRILRSGRV